MIWRRVLVPETMSLTSTGLGGLCRKALLEEAANALVKGRSTPHAQDQVSILVSRALQRGKLKSGNGTNSCLTPEILVVPKGEGVDGHAHNRTSRCTHRHIRMSIFRSQLQRTLRVRQIQSRISVAS